MATVSILQPPSELAITTSQQMASRRTPLADVPNAVNSPFRIINGKRTRAQVGDVKDAYIGQPPAKKQIIDTGEDGEENLDSLKHKKTTLVRSNVLSKLEDNLPRRSHHAQPTAFEKKLASVREKRSNITTAAPPPPQTRSVERAPRTQAENAESIRLWKKHYRQQMPHFVFYFDAVPEEARVKAMRQIHYLGAREEKFFSKAVTHVVTTRPIPPSRSSDSPDDDGKYAEQAPVTTISNPGTTLDQRKTANLLDAHLQRRSGLSMQNADILTRARDLDIKIWALEKLHRVLTAMLETDTNDRASTEDPRTQRQTSSRNPTRPGQGADLEQLLRNEKVIGPTDRDMTVATQDMVTLKGIYLYIHDMDEKTKPVMARDYPKPSNKEQGKWPQFRIAAPGRCPFIEDPTHAKKVMQAERQSKAQDTAQRKTRAGGWEGTEQPLTEVDANLRRSPRKHIQSLKIDVPRPLDPPQAPPLKRQSSEIAPAYFGSAQASLRNLPRMVRGEPVASGIQRSSVTSAIRSQAISSAAISSTAPGLSRRIPDSKEISMLKRQVFERGATAQSNQSMPSSYMNDVRAAINDDQAPPPRAAKRKAQETLGVVYEGNEATRSRHDNAKKPRQEKEAKPGYCENCRDKFDDFDEHIASRKHRRFALTQDNWKELDGLLAQLKRPHKIA